MADIDINELQNITALADADELLAIVAGLGKKVSWAKVKELLAEQLPVATTTSKGLMDGELMQGLLQYKGFVSPNDVDTTTEQGIYTITYTDGGAYGTLVIFNTRTNIHTGVIQLQFRFPKLFAYRVSDAGSSFTNVPFNIIGS